MRVNYEHHNVRRVIYLPLIWTPLPSRAALIICLHLTIFLVDKLYFTYGAILNNPILIKLCIQCNQQFIYLLKHL